MVLEMLFPVVNSHRFVTESSYTTDFWTTSLAQNKFLVAM